MPSADAERMPVLIAKEGGPMWRGFETALLEDGMLTWMGFGKSFFTKRMILVLTLSTLVLATIVHYLN
jgi:hypothetical protein